MYFRNLPQFLENLNKRGKKKTSSTVVGWLLAHGSDAIGPAHKPIHFAGMLGVARLIQSPRATRVGWHDRRLPGGDQPVTRCRPRALWGLRGGAGQGGEERSVTPQKVIR
jgi:hypothetical protein